MNNRSPMKSNLILVIGSYLFCIFVLLDPVNDIVGLKIPTFLIMLIGLAFSGKPKPIALGILVLLLFLQGLSFICGYLSDLPFNYDITRQYLFFFLTLFVIVYSPYISFFRPILFSCFLLAGITIIGYGIIIYYPEIENVLYLYLHEEHNDVILIKSIN